MRRTRATSASRSGGGAPCTCSRSACSRPGQASTRNHAVACGVVTVVWSGNPDALKDLPQPAPKSFAVESLAFKFADGTSKGFAPKGQVFFNDWRFEVFSPDCATVALLTDHFGPYHVVKTAELRGYLEGRVKPLQVQALSEKAKAPMFVTLAPRTALVRVAQWLNA